MAPFAAAILLIAPALGQDAQLPIPDDAAQSKALALIKEVYKADYEAAKTNPQKISLANKLLQDSAATKSAADRYALLRVSKDIAAQAGDIDTAFAATSQMQAEFDVDGLVLKAGAAASAGKSLRLPAEHKGLAPYFLRLIDEAVIADRYDVAKDIGEAALESVRKARDSDSLKQLVEAKKRVEELEKSFAEVQAALEVLKAKPTDPVANLTVGKFRCFVKEQWEAGLPMLALGSDEQLKALAAAELMDAPDALALGDGWWDLADGLMDVRQREAARLRAGTWYTKALSTTEGLTRAKVEKRLSGIDVAPEAKQEAANLTGIWRSSTGNVFELVDEGQRVAVKLFSSRNIKSMSGVLRRDGNKLIKEKWDCTFVVDPKRTWDARFEAELHDEDTILARYESLEFDSKGRVKKREFPVKGVLRRVKRDE
jgi:hypothetical protein